MRPDAEGATVEYRVETRDVRRDHTDTPDRWYPEGDHWSTTDLAVAEARVTERAHWYAHPLAFEHRITSRLVTPWTAPRKSTCCGFYPAWNDEEVEVCASCMTPVSEQPTEADVERERALDDDADMYAGNLEP